MYLCVNVQLNCHFVLFIICCIWLGRFASRNSLKSQHFLALRMSFLVIGMGKEEKKSYERVKESIVFDFSLWKVLFPCEKGWWHFSFPLNQVISSNDFGAQMHKQVSQYDGGQPQAEGRRSGKRGPALASSGVKNRDKDFWWKKSHHIL